jgi:hypothetical protein
MSEHKKPREQNKMSINGRVRHQDLYRQNKALMVVQDDEFA